jgi:hypothetical protein
VRTNLGYIKDPKNHKNYNRIAIKDKRREPKAYKANTIRIIRHLIYPKKRKSTKLGSNIIDSKSNIKSGFKAVARL